ncbi:MAG: dual specificity protein phosphatase family protein [Candidatus Omnitrophica bacterium]|nr:dual specificity protein phosphatase family protein [Candidatus Omnitrophota bacterium]
MRIFLNPLIICLTVALAGVLGPNVAFSNEEEALAELKQVAFNFRETAPGVYRSGLIPSEAAPLLKELGVKTVISFDNDLKRAAREEKKLRELGIEAVSLPWSGWDVPEEEVISETISLIDSEDHKPILVHCKHGQERTGAAIAAWRIKSQNWSFEKAYQEMKSCGFRPFQYGHLKKYVYEFAREHARVPAGHGDEKAEFGSPLERMKTNTLSFLYGLRKLNPFLPKD